MNKYWHNLILLQIIPLTLLMQIDMNALNKLSCTKFKTKPSFNLEHIVS